MSALAFPARSAIKWQNRRRGPCTAIVNSSDCGATDQTLLGRETGPGTPGDHHAERDDYILSTVVPNRRTRRSAIPPIQIPPRRPKTVYLSPSSLPAGAGGSTGFGSFEAISSRSFF